MIYSFEKEGNIMSEKFKVKTFASIHRKWEDFTDFHKEARNHSEEELDSYFRGLKGEDIETHSLIISGGFGSGKTQLIFHLLKYSWENKIPALFVDLKRLIANIEEDLFLNDKSKPIESHTFVEYVTKLALARLGSIENLYKDNDPGKYKGFWLPQPPTTWNPPCSFSQYFKNLNLDSMEIREIISNTTKKKKGIVVFIDEVEHGYNEVKDLIKGGHVLRELSNAVGTFESDTYISLAMGYLSYYELFLSEFSGDSAYKRRIRLVQLPPIDSDYIYAHSKDLGIEKQKSNILWWLTRGRLGWLNHLKEVVNFDDFKIDKMITWVQFQQLSEQISEGLPVFDVEELLRRERGLKYDQKKKAAFRNIILNLYPRKISQLPNYLKEELENLSNILIHSNNLTNIIDVISAFEYDIKDHFSRAAIKIKQEIIEIIKNALENILSSFVLRKNGQKFMCVGAPKIRLEDDSKKFIKSILDISMNYISENKSDSTDKQQTIHYLYNLLGIIEDEDTWRKINFFKNVKQLFENNELNKEDDYHLILAPWELEYLIPMYLSNPIISKDFAMTIDNMEEFLKDFYSYDMDKQSNFISDISEFIFLDDKELDVIKILPFPRNSIISDTESKIVETVQNIIQSNKNNLSSQNTILHFYLTDVDERIVQNIQVKLQNDEFFSLLKTHLNRITIDKIGGNRLSNFIKSLFVLLMTEKSQTGSIDNIQEGLRLDQRRRLEVFKHQCYTFFDEKVKDARKKYKDGLLNPGLKKLLEFGEDIKNITHIFERTTKYRYSRKIFSLLLEIIDESVRSSFQSTSKSLKIDYCLIPNRTLKLKAGLPSIYQEFKRRKCKSILQLRTKSPVIDSIIKYVAKEKKDIPISDLFSESESLFIEFFNDFEAIIKSNFSIDRDDSNSILKLLFRILIIQYIIIQYRFNETINDFKIKANDILTNKKRLEERLEDLEKILKELREAAPLKIDMNIEFEVVNKGRKTILKDELIAMSNTLQEIIQLTSNPDKLNEHQINLITVFTVLGYPKEEELLLSQLETLLKDWNNEINDNIYQPLNKLKQTLLGINFEGESEKTIQVSPQTISNIKDMSNISARLSTLISKIESSGQDYNNCIDKYKSVHETIKQSINKIEENIKKLS